MAATTQIEDPWQKISNQNPFFFDYSSPYYMGGAPTAVAPDWKSYVKGKKWETDKSNWENFAKSLGGSSASSSPWSTAATPSAPKATSPSDNIQLLKKNIDPGLTAALESILGQVPGIKDKLALLSVDKNPAASAMISSLARGFTGPEGEMEAGRQRLDDFVKSYMGDVGKTGQYTQADVDEISRVMGGDLGKRLAGARRGIETGLQDEYTRGLGQIGRGLSFTSMAGRGPSSGSDAVAASEFSNLLSKLRLARSEAQRADILAEEAAKQSMIGRREALINEQARLGLLPIELYNAQADRDISQIGNLANLIYSTQYQRPEMTPAELLQTQLALYGLGKQQLYGNQPLNITGLAGNFPNITIPRNPGVSAYIPPPVPQVSYFDAGAGYANPFMPTQTESLGAPLVVPDYRLQPQVYSYYQDRFENPEQWGGGIIPPYSTPDYIRGAMYSPITNSPVGTGDLNPYIEPIA